MDATSPECTDASNLEFTITRNFSSESCKSLNEVSKELLDIPNNKIQSNFSEGVHCSGYFLT